MNEEKKIPFFDLSRQYALIAEEVENATLEVMRSQKYVMGPQVFEFENSLNQWIDTEYGTSVGSGTEALIIALKALEIRPGDKVLTSSYSFIASAGAIEWVGAESVFADIPESSFNLNLESIKNAWEDSIKAIILPHLFGHSCDLDPIIEFAKQKGVFLIEDFAQCIGAEYKGKSVGTFGDFGCTSFYPTKNLGGVGEGGYITSQSKELIEKAKLIKAHGMIERYKHVLRGTNARMDSIQAASLLVKLKYLDKWTDNRTQLAKTYNERLSGLESKEVVLPQEPKNTHSVWNQYVIRISNRDQVRDELTNKGIGTDIFYPTPIPEQESYSLDQVEKRWPNSYKASREALALPIFPELRAEEQNFIIESLLEI